MLLLESHENSKAYSDHERQDSGITACKSSRFFAAAFGLVSKQSSSFTVKLRLSSQNSIKSIVNFKLGGRKRLNSAFSV